MLTADHTEPGRRYRTGRSASPVFHPTALDGAAPIAPRKTLRIVFVRVESIVSMPRSRRRFRWGRLRLGSGEGVGLRAC